MAVFALSVFVMTNGRRRLGRLSRVVALKDIGA